MVNLKKHYLAFVLDKKSRDNLIKSFPPLFEKTICHHITLKFNGIEVDSVDKFYGIENVNVIGYIADDALETLVVEFDGTTKREDGGTYHITHSLIPSKRKPVDSNNLLKYKKYTKISPIKISGEVRLEEK